MTPTVSILDAMNDPALFGRWFADASWDAWRAFLRATFARPIVDRDAEVIRACTGCDTLPSTSAREVYAVCGRRAGKSRIAALIAVFAAFFRDYRPQLAPGERATVMLLAADRQQARVCLRYVAGLIDGTPMLASMVESRTAESIHLSNRVSLEVHTSNFRSVRGYSIATVVLDELAFWPSTDVSANPDVEVVAALRPALATIPGSLLVAISSPYWRRGALWDAYRKHWGQPDGALVWQASSRRMNPSLDEAVVEAAYLEDAAVAAAEFGGLFRRDLESFVSREALEAAVVPGRFELPPVPRVTYRGFVDPSGGAQDSMTLAVGHREGETAIVDALREVRPPFAPEKVVAEFVELLRTYNVRRVQGDRYGGEWPREQFRKLGVAYDVCEKPKSDLYKALLPALNSSNVALLDHPRLVSQLGSLERRTARGGRDSVDHPPRGRDDVANVAAGLVAGLLARRGGVSASAIMAINRRAHGPSLHRTVF